MGGRRWCAKKRDNRAMTAPLLSKKAWQDEWTKLGAEGGMCATVLGSWSEWRAQMRDLEKQLMLRVGAVTQARRDMKDLERSYLTVKKRRACPEGIPPAEIWAMLIHASRNLSPAGQGFGYQTKKVEPTGILALVERLLCRVRSLGTVRLLRGITAREHLCTKATSRAPWGDEWCTCYRPWEHSSSKS